MKYALVIHLLSGKTVISSPKELRSEETWDSIAELFGETFHRNLSFAMESEGGRVYIPSANIDYIEVKEIP